MDSDSRKSSTRPVDNSSKALLQRSKLLRERGLELKAELQLGLGRTHDLVMTCQRLAKIVSGSLPTPQLASGSLAGTKNVRPKLSARNPVVSHVLKRRPPLRFNQGLVVEPIRNRLLANAGSAHELRNAFGESRLAAGDLDSPLQGGNVLLFHKRPEYTSMLVVVKQDACFSMNKGPCNVVAMTLPAKKPATSTKKRKAKPGADGRTIGERAWWAMGRKGLSYKEAQLVADCQRIAGTDSGGKPRILQQNVNQILSDAGDSSKYAVIVAEALGVRGVWLQFGIGDPYEEKSALSLVEGSKR